MLVRDRDAITFVEFSLSDRDHPFVAASRGGGRAVLEALIPRGDVEYLTVVESTGRSVPPDTGPTNSPRQCWIPSTGKQ